MIITLLSLKKHTNSKFSSFRHHIPIFCLLFDSPLSFGRFLFSGWSSRLEFLSSEKAFTCEIRSHKVKSDLIPYMYPRVCSSITGHQAYTSSINPEQNTL